MDDGRPAILLEEGQARWRWTRGYVENVAAAIALAATDQRAASHTYNVGEERAPTEEEWVRRIGQAAGWQGEVKAVRRRLMPESLILPYDWRHHLAATLWTEFLVGTGHLLNMQPGSRHVKAPGLRCPSRKFNLTMRRLPFF